jgi:hypothetical protein
MSLSNYLEEQLLNHLRPAGTTFSKPAGLYLKLHIGDPGEDCTANAAAETTRKVCVFAAASNPGGAMVGAATSWTAYAQTETLTHFSVWDAVTAGNPLGSGALSASAAMTNAGTDTLTITPTWTLD